MRKDKKDSRVWKILVAVYMAYSVSADIILLLGIAWLILSG
jgi:hypothetical protein